MCKSLNLVKNILKYKCIFENAFSVFFYAICIWLKIYFFFICSFICKIKAWLIFGSHKKYVFLIIIPAIQHILYEN